MRFSKGKGSTFVLIAAAFIVGSAIIYLICLHAGSDTLTLAERKRFATQAVLAFAAFNLIYLSLESFISSWPDRVRAMRHLANCSNSVEAAGRYVWDYHALRRGEEFTRSEEGELINRVIRHFGLSEETAAAVVSDKWPAQRRWNPGA